jgi:hypothetical protein
MVRQHGLPNELCKDAHRYARIIDMYIYMCIVTDRTEDDGDTDSIDVGGGGISQHRPI